MAGFNYGHGWSSTQWETSFYGGYSRTLYDYAEIKTDFNVIITPPTKSSLSYYLGTKLGKLFLLKCAQYELMGQLLYKSEVVIEEPKWFFPGAKPEKFIVISEIGKNATLDEICNVDTEMANLFRHYKDEILQTEIKFKVKDDNKGQDNQDGSGDNDPQNEEKKKKKKGSSEDYTEAIYDLIKKTKALKPYSFYNKIGDEDIPEPTFHYPYSTRKSIMDSTDKLLARQLAERLDISFDTDKDVIKSLKAGKLDMNKLAEAVAGNEHIYQRVEEDQITKPFSIVILCDESGSMGYTKLHHQHRLVKILYETFSSVLPPDKISVFGHTGDEAPDVYIYQDKYNLTFEDKIDNMMERDLANNYDGPVIEAIHKKIRSSSNDNILFIVISDGQPAGEGYGGQPAIDELKRIIEKCKRDNFVTVGIGFAYDGVKEIYKYHAIVDNFDKMVEKVSALLNKVVKTEFQ